MFGKIHSIRVEEKYNYSPCVDLAWIYWRERLKTFLEPEEWFLDHYLDSSRSCSPILRCLTFEANVFACSSSRKSPCYWSCYCTRCSCSNRWWCTWEWGKLPLKGHKCNFDPKHFGQCCPWCTWWRIPKIRGKYFGIKSRTSTLNEISN